MLSKCYMTLSLIQIKVVVEMIFNVGWTLNISCYKWRPNNTKYRKVESNLFRIKEICLLHICNV